MSTYRKKGSQVYTMDFVFHGQRIKESTRVTTKTLAERVERMRRTALEEGRAGIKRTVGPQLFKTVAEKWVEMKSSTWSVNGRRIEETNLGHIYPAFAKSFVNDIEPEEIAAYQKKRIAEGYANKTVNLEVGTIRSVLIYCGQWARVQGWDGGARTGKKVKTLKTRDDHGVALTAPQEWALLQECSRSNSRMLLAIVYIALYTGARFGVISKLRWENVDFAARCLQWGRDKTVAGDHRIIPMGVKVIKALELWALNFPDRKPEHYVFPSEKYGTAGHKFGKEGDKKKAVVYDIDPTTPIGSIKTAWEGAQKRSGVRCRIHDLRHTAVSRMLNEGVPLMKIAQIVGWSASQTILMAKRYGHFSTEQLRTSVETINLEVSPLNPPPQTSSTPEESRKLLM